MSTTGRHHPVPSWDQVFGMPNSCGDGLGFWEHKHSHRLSRQIHCAARYSSAVLSSIVAACRFARLIGYDGGMDSGDSEKSVYGTVLFAIGFLAIALVFALDRPSVLLVIALWFAGGILIGTGIGRLAGHLAIGALTGFLIQICTFVWLASQMGSARPTFMRAECDAHLHTLYHALAAYVTAKGDVPRDDNGKASVQSLTAPDAPENYRVNANVLKCPAAGGSDGFDYIVNPNLSALDFAPDSRTIVACDRPANHAEAMLILLGDGSVRFCTAPRGQREKLAKAVQSGDEEARTYDDPYEPR
jgi:hypothetical protein